MEYIESFLNDERVQVALRKGRTLLRKYLKGNQIAYQVALTALQKHTGITDRNVLLLIVMALVTLVIGGSLFVIGLFWKGKASKEYNREKTSPNKPASILKVFSSVDDGKDCPSLTTALSPGQASSLSFSFDDFMNKLHKHPILVQKHKSGEKKTRCMKISHNCDLKLYKLYHVNSGDIIPVGSGYIKLPLLELKDCFLTKDAHNSFILDFKSKTLQLSGPIGLETKQIVNGFRILIDKMKDDRRYLELWKAKFTQSSSQHVASPTPNPSTPTRPIDQHPSGLVKSPSSSGSSYYQFGKKK